MLTTNFERHDETANLSTLLDVVVDKGAQDPVHSGTRVMRFVAAATIIGTFFETNANLKKPTESPISNCFYENIDDASNFGDDILSVESMPLGHEESFFTRDEEVQSCSLNVETSSCSTSKKESSYSRYSDESSHSWTKKQAKSSPVRIMCRKVRAFLNFPKNCLKPSVTDFD